MRVPAAEAKGLGIHALQLVAHVVEGAGLAIAQGCVIVAEADLPADDERIPTRRLPCGFALGGLQLGACQSEGVLVGRAIDALPGVIGPGGLAELQLTRLGVAHAAKEAAGLLQVFTQRVGDLRASLALDDGVLKDDFNLSFGIPGEVPDAAGEVQAVTLFLLHEGVGRAHAGALTGLVADEIAQAAVVRFVGQCALHTALEVGGALCPLPADAVQHKGIQAARHCAQQAVYLSAGRVIVGEEEVPASLLDGAAHGGQGEGLQVVREDQLLDLAEQGFAASFGFFLALAARFAAFFRFFHAGGGDGSELLAAFGRALNC